MTGCAGRKLPIAEHLQCTEQPGHAGVHQLKGSGECEPC